MGHFDFRRDQGVQFSQYFFASLLALQTGERRIQSHGTGISPNIGTQTMIIVSCFKYVTRCVGLVFSQCQETGMVGAGDSVFKYYIP